VVFGSVTPLLSHDELVLGIAGPLQRLSGGVLSFVESLRSTRGEVAGSRELVDSANPPITGSATRLWLPDPSLTALVAVPAAAKTPRR